MPSTRSSSPPPTAFSWGYWGWGNATQQLVAGVDAVEASRGFDPPLFVDVRFNRKVRAVGFSDAAFERLLGPRRYIWMNRLGNKRIGEQSGPRMEIADPDTAHELLEHIVLAAKNNRRVIFFCSCEHLVTADGVECHRNEVARLLREAATVTGANLQICEWPGGEPRPIAATTTGALMKSLKRGRAFLPLADRRDLSEIAGLPWGSPVEAKAGAESLRFVSGPARFQAGHWCLPVLHRFEADASRAMISEWGARFRRERRLTPVDESAPRVAGGLSAECIYTIAHIDKLKAIAQTSGRGTLHEKRSWATGARLLADATTKGLSMPILFADAADCSRLLYWALLSKIELAGTGTSYSFRELKVIFGRHVPQELVLLASREHISPGFIRPYALCVTPEFLAHPN